ncbi:MAG TPA: acyl-CoA desaturase [Dehalococcoidia bacterium]|nr:acyl-CoA desaturase [Dehalococcoidia bacterium]
MQGVGQPSVLDGARIYAKLKSEVRAAGILSKSYSFYIPLILVAITGYLLSAWAIFALDSYPLLVLACLGFTFFTVQLAGVMHDSGHRAVFSSVRSNEILGAVCCGLIGMVFDNWRTRHNIHHAFPNQEGKDPDLEIPLIATSARLYARKSPLQRALMPYQAYYYFPLGALASFSNRLGSLSYFRHRRSRNDLSRFAIYLPAVVFLFVLPFALFSPAKALFVLSIVHITSGIYLANCFAPNHKGMAIISSNSTMSFIERQVMTSRNVRGGLLTDILLVGLNRQVEHHLFPNCPRNKLHLLRPYVMNACKALGLNYVEAGIIETNRDILRQLRGVPSVATLPALPAAAPAAAD